MQIVHDQQNTEEEDDIYYSKFVNAIKSKSTKMDYTYRLKYFINFLNVKSHTELVENEEKNIENDLEPVTHSTHSTHNKEEQSDSTDKLVKISSKVHQLE
jgi:hypothetical protein